MRNQAGLGITPLMRAARAGDISRCRALAVEGDDINAVDAAHWTAMMHASSTGSLPVVDFLLERGAKVDVQAFDHVTALLAAVAGQHADVAERLLVAGANASDGIVLPGSDTGQWSAMRVAACNGDDATLAALAGAGARPWPAEAVFYVAARVEAAGARLRLHRSGSNEYSFNGEDCRHHPDEYVVDPASALPAQFPACLQEMVKRHEQSVVVLDDITASCATGAFATFSAAGTEVGEAGAAPQPCHVHLDHWKGIGFSPALQEVLHGEREDGLMPLLWLCAGAGGVELVRTLLERGAEPGPPSRWEWPRGFVQGFDALAYAAAERHQEVVALLADQLDIVNEALCRAAANGDAATVSRLLTVGADATAVFEGGNALVHAHRSKLRSDVVRLLLAAGAPAGSRYRQDTPVIVSAAFQRNLAVLQLLVGAGADPNDTNDEGWGPLHTAVRANLPEMVEWLLASGARPDARTTTGRTPLMIAATDLPTPDPRLASALAAAGADLEATDAEGQTALVIAIKHNSQPLVEQLLALGVDGSGMDRDGRTTVMLAVEIHMSEVVPALVRAGALLDAVDHEGNTALMRVCRRPSANGYQVSQLLDCGANTDIRNVAGQTALQLALAASSDYVVQLLRECGAASGGA